MKNTITPVAATTISPEQALEILNGLIAKADTPASEIPQIFQNLLAVYNNAFAAVVAPIEKKRRRNKNLSPNIGWPMGVSRAEYSGWKEQQIAAGVKEGLNPQEYKRQRDGITVPQIEAAPAPTVPHETTPAPTVADAKPRTARQAKEAGIDTKPEPVAAGNNKKK